MKYKQLTSEERYVISSYRKTGLSVYEIAKEMGRHKSTIYREIKRRLRQGTCRPSRAVIRLYLHKRKSIAKLTRNNCTQIAYDLNTRPGKRLQFNTPWNSIWE